ncbi:hypothetical protein O988_03525 [Pseudogymnoascus sp. VKM F-3808]|nr:hypothetical protein O988_03525 [Pseudogymnoascus sp. VKM F-3808]
MTTINKAAWLMSAKANPFEVADAPMPVPQAHEVVIRNYAVAANPVDTVQQDHGRLVNAYPHVIGSDSSGVIAAVGSAVTNFEVGDHVVATMDNIETQRASNGAFQFFSATKATLVGKIPHNIAFKDACVFGMAMNTAAAGLYQKENMALPYPTVPRKPNGKTFLVWGGSSSVGACAVQLAIGSGYDVAVTAGPNNADLCREIGAKWVFDHTKESIVDEIVGALKGSDFGGAFDAISKPDTLTKSGQIVSRLEGYKFLESVLPSRFPRPEDLASDIKFGQVWGLSPGNNEVGPAIWWDWVPHALADGSLKCKPDAEVVGEGLEFCQTVLDSWKKGVSGKKIVAKLL